MSLLVLKNPNGISIQSPFDFGASHNQKFKKNINALSPASGNVISWNGSEFVASAPAAADLTAYLTSATAASTYALSSALTTTNGNVTANASSISTANSNITALQAADLTFETAANAAAVYETKTNATNIYATKTSLGTTNGNVSANASAITSLQAADASFLTSASAASTYQPVGSYVTLTSTSTLSNKTLTAPLLTGETKFGSLDRYESKSIHSGTANLNVVELIKSVPVIVYSNMLIEVLVNYYGVAGFAKISAQFFRETGAISLVAGTSSAQVYGISLGSEVTFVVSGSNVLVSLVGNATMNGIPCSVIITQNMTQ